jgi:hypothetical protein
MLESISAEATLRLLEVKAYLQFLRSITKISRRSAVRPSFSAAKGFFFVHLYGVYEYTVASALRETIRVINRSGVTLVDCRPSLLSLALDGQCESLSFSGRSTSWAKRVALFERARSADSVAINDSLVPTDGRNLQLAQLQSIWTAFSIQDPVLPDIRLRGTLEELVDKRNAIAHGRETAAGVGRRFTVQDLDARYRAVNRLCSHIVATFDEYLNRRHYRV